MRAVTRRFLLFPPCRLFFDNFCAQMHTATAIDGASRGLGQSLSPYLESYQHNVRVAAETYASRALFHCLHCVFNLVKPPVRAPRVNLGVILHKTNLEVV